MGKQGPKSKFTGIACPNKSCKFRQDNNRVRQEAITWIAETLPLPFGAILPGCASSVMMGCKAPGTM